MLSAKNKRYIVGTLPIELACQTGSMLSRNALWNGLQTLHHFFFF